MRAKPFRGLLILPLMMTLAGACSTSKSGTVASSENSRGAAVTTTTARNSPGAAATPKPGPARVGSKFYTDPDDAFAVSVPADWRVEREDKDGARKTLIRPAQQPFPELSIVTFKSGTGKIESDELRSLMLTESSESLFGVWLEQLREQARVEGSGDVLPTRLNDVSALQTDVTYYRGDADDPRRGRAIYLIGDSKAFFICLTAVSARFGELEEIVSTLRIEP